MSGPRRRSAVAPRAVAYTAIGALTIGALLFGLLRARQVYPPRAMSTVPPAATPLDTPRWSERTDTLHRGETLVQVLERGGLPNALTTTLLRAATAIDERRVRAGMPIVLRRRGQDTVPSEIVFHLDVDHLLHMRRGDSGWVGDDRHLPWRTDTVAVSGRITSTLYEAMDAGAASLPRAARAELAWALADIYEYRVDMSRDLQKDDAFRVLFARSIGPGGVVRIDGILAASFELSGSLVEAVRYAHADGKREYFDQDGKSMRAAFLRAPLEFRRISSVFGMRKHPILGIWRAHTGTDYAASAGTPVRAIGDGTIVFAGRKGGYGNALEIRHRNGYVSRYGHLRAFAKRIRVGRRVGIAETIAYVGMTGLATAPHLHFEVLVDGRQRDPRVALRDKAGTPIQGAERERFDAARSTLIAALDRASGSLAPQIAGR